ncbi:MAG: hypothetical protein V4772_26160 [Pseudomonadota bacterium]
MAFHVFSTQFLLMAIQRTSRLRPFERATFILAPFAAALVMALGTALAISFFIERSLNRLELACIFGLAGIACFGVAGFFAWQRVEHRKLQSLKDSALW